MRTILKSILLMSLCSSATAPAMAIKRANHDKKEANIHEEEASDSTRHQPLTESSMKLNEVVVTGLTGSQKLKQSPAPISFVSARQLEMQPSTNIIDAIAHQPGVSQITTGSGISKPVIRGLGYNRVVVVNDGIRQEGQQWGDEHGIERPRFGSFRRDSERSGKSHVWLGCDGRRPHLPLRSYPCQGRHESKFLNGLSNQQRTF